MLKVENLSKRFGDFEAVTDLSFTLEPGEVLGLIGPNGAGKTTTLRSIAGILDFDQGRISIGGHDVVSDPIEAKKHFAYLPDAPGFFETLTVWEHLRFTAQLYDVPKAQERSEHLLETFGLLQKRKAFTGQLSRGQRQALGLICAFLHRPKLMILDEPMTALDPSRIHTVNEMIRATSKEGTAFILSSHLLTILEQTYTKVLVMNQGKSIFYGTAQEVEESRKKGGKDIPLEELFFRVTHSHETHHSR